MALSPLPTRNDPQADARRAAERLPLPGTLAERDVRARRPPLLSFLLRVDTLRRIARAISLLLLDFVAVSLAISTAIAIREAARGEFVMDSVQSQTEDIVSFVFLITVLLFWRSGLYAGRAERPGLTRIVAGLTQVTFVALGYALIEGYSFTSYYLFYGSLAFAVLYVASLRFVYDRLTGLILRAAGYQRRAVLVGTGKHIEAVAHAFTASPQPPVDIVGFVSLTPRPDNGLKSLGAFDELGGILDDHRVDEVILADPDFPQDAMLDLVDRCHRRGVRVKIAPSTMEVLVHRAEFIPGDAVPLFELRPPVFEGVDYFLKRSFDLVASGLLILVLAPVLAAAALAVKLTSRGPVLFHSMRAGIGEAPFPCLKFRTMVEGAEHQQDDLEAHNEAGGAIFKVRDDPRVTSVGGFLRRFSIDELPQLFNVLRGEMSLVGPRPLPMRDFERLEDWHRKRYLVLPGLTGLWQVSGRSELDFDDLVRLDFLYLERWSVFLDFTVLLKTIPAVLARKGAY